ncbi:MerR family DNA-binding protein, partial [Pseudomonas aeruginosa]
PGGRPGRRGCLAAGGLERLALLGRGRAAGWALYEIAGLGAADGALRIDRAALADKADDLDRTIRRLAAMRDGLRHAAACPAREHMDCPTFRRLLRAAAAGAIKPRRKAPGA